MTDAIARLRALLEAATPGEWSIDHVGDDVVWCMRGDPETGIPQSELAARTVEPKDAALIAAAKNAIGPALACVEALEKIARGEVEVPDDELGSVWVPMGAQEAGEIAHAALSSFTAALEGQTNEP